MSAAAAAVPGTYMGRSQMGNGRPIPINPATGQVDINALLANMVDRTKDLLLRHVEARAGRNGRIAAVPVFQDGARSTGPVQRQCRERRSWKPISKGRAASSIRPMI